MRHTQLLCDGRGGAHTVTVKRKKADMGTLIRLAMSLYTTTETGALIAVARPLLLDPRPSGTTFPSRHGVFGIERCRSRECCSQT